MLRSLFWVLFRQKALENRKIGTATNGGSLTRLRKSRPNLQINSYLVFREALLVKVYEAVNKQMGKLNVSACALGACPLEGTFFLGRNSLRNSISLV